MPSILTLVRFYVFIIFLFGCLALCTGDNVKKSVYENREDTGETNDEPKEESMEISVENEPNNITCTRRLNSQMHDIQVAKSKQFPFMAAIMSHQNEYLCAGAVVSNGLLLTTAQCTKQPISYVLLNATKAKKDDTTVTLHVTKTEKFPTFVGGDLLKNVALVYTEKHNNSIASKIRLSNYTTLKAIVDFEAIGFGLNADIGNTKELQYIGLENRSPYEPNEVFEINGYFDCVDTKVITCFKDSGGPVIFDNELIGVVVKGQDVCTDVMTSKYALNKKIVDALPTFTFKAWLDEKIKKNEELRPVPLTNYPLKPVVHEPLHQMTSSVERPVISKCIFIVPLYFVLKWYI